MRKLLVGALLLVVGAELTLPTEARAQTAQEPKTAKSLQIIYIAGAKFAADDPLRSSVMFSSLYLLGGAGSHSVALAGDDAIALVDTKGLGWGEALRVKAGLTTDVPIELIFNTSPRAGGANAEFPDAKMIVAHENTKALMAKTAAFSGANAKGLPTKTFTDTLSVPFKVPGETVGKTIDSYHFGAGYSAGDTIVVFPTYGVAVFGDLFPGKQVPAIDLENGGRWSIRWPTRSRDCRARGSKPSFPGAARPRQRPFSGGSRCGTWRNTRRSIATCSIPRRRRLQPARASMMRRRRPPHCCPGSTRTTA